MAKEYVKNYPNEIAQINEHLSAIEKVVESLPAEASFTKSLQTTVINFRKKVDAFLVTGSALSEQQKAAIAAIKAGKSPKEILSALQSTSENPDGGSAGSNDEKPTTSKRGKKHN